MSTFAQRLDDLMSEAGITNMELAKQIGITKQAITLWMSGETSNPASKPLLAAADILGTTVRYLLYGQGPRKSESDFDSESEVRVKICDARFSAGPGAAVPEWEPTGETLTFKREWLRKNRYNPKDLVVASVKGNSMEPTLFDGDRIVINRAQREPKNGRVFAISYGGNLYVKRIMELPGDGIRILSDNEDNRRNLPIDLYGEDKNTVRIDGQVVLRMGIGGL